jgi:DNA-binding NarL/FixJ family response regulator
MQLRIQDNTITGSVAPIRVLIADERADFRRALRTLLEPEVDLSIVGEASDATEARAVAQQVNPDVIIIDIALFYGLASRPGTQSTCRTVVMVSTLQRANIIQAFLGGARAVVPKPSPLQIWSQSIRAVVAGQYWLLDESIAILLEALQEKFPQQVDTETGNDNRLTPREAEIVDKIVQGLSNKEVGQVFSIREKTVKHHLTNIFTKLGVSSRLELAVFALKHRPPAFVSRRDDTLEQGTVPINTRRVRQNQRD